MRSPVDHGHRLASCDTSLVVSSGVDCRRRRNVYDKKPQRYAKDNRTAHLTECSDKSVAYVTNNNRLYSTFFLLLKLTTDRHEASCGPLCDSRATCFCFAVMWHCCSQHGSTVDSRYGGCRYQTQDESQTTKSTNQN